MTASDQFGASLGPWAVEQAVLAVLQATPGGGAAPRLVYYLADQERALGLPPRTLGSPPGPSSYRGGVDADTLEAEWLPMVHVVAQPAGEPLIYAGGTEYAQRYELTITCTAGDDNEDTARLLAGSYAMAVAKILPDNADLGIGATDTVVTLPATELLDPDSSRQVCRAVIAGSTLVSQAIQVTGGPLVWQSDPYESPGDGPEAETLGLTVTAVPDSQSL